MLEVDPEGSTVVESNRWSSAVMLRPKVVADSAETSLAEGGAWKGPFHGGYIETGTLVGG
jgi:hypothetical protein